MTNEMINNMGTRGYAYGDNKAIQVAYDPDTDAVVIKEALFRHILRQIPSQKECKNPIVINGMVVEDKDFDS